MVWVLSGSGGGVVSCNNGNSVVIFFLQQWQWYSLLLQSPSLYAAIFLFAAATVQQVQWFIKCSVLMG